MLVVGLYSPVAAQTKRAPARRPAAQAATKTEPAMLACPSVLGEGVDTKRTFCDVLTGTNQAEGIVLTADNTLLSRAVVQNEFRTAADLVDRVSGGAGPGGVKAVAPSGTESISITIPAAEESVSILGERLSVLRVDGGPDTFTTPGRPIAIVSNVMLQYRPAPARRPATRRR
jgi:hypothetical protein